MRSTAALAVLLLAALLSASAQPTRPPTAPPAEQKPAPAAEQKPAAAASAKGAEIVHNPLGTVKDAKVAALQSNKSSDTNATEERGIAARRYLIVSGTGQYTLWANLAQIFVAVEPRVFQSLASNATANATAGAQQQEPKYLPDDKAKSEIKAVYDKVLSVLQKFNAIDISSSPSFVSSPMFEPNVTAFRMFMQHQAQLMQRRRNALAQRTGRNLLLQGRPLSMHNQPFVPNAPLMSQREGLMHRSSIHNINAIRNAQQMDVEVEGVDQPRQHMPTAAPAKAEETKKDAATPPPKAEEKKDAIAKEQPKEQNKTEPIAAEKKKDDDVVVPLPDPKSLITFKGFRFYRPLSAMVPIESVMEIAQSLRTVNATIESVQLAVSPKAFDEARAVATKTAIERALTVADAALGAAKEKRGGVSTVLISTSNPPHLQRVPMFRAAFLRPQPITVNSHVVLRVGF